MLNLVTFLESSQIPFVSFNLIPRFLNRIKSTKLRSCKMEISKRDNLVKLRGNGHVSFDGSFGDDHFQFEESCCFASEKDAEPVF